MQISYQIPRDVLIRIWFRRMMCRPRILAALCVYVLIAAVCFIIGSGAEIAAYILLCLTIAKPIGIYRAITKAIGNNSQLTDSKTVDFNSSGIVSTGSNWKNEMPWTRFKGFSEDDSYFYLHLSDNGIASVVPKSAFSTEQQQMFREYEKVQTPNKSL